MIALPFGVLMQNYPRKRDVPRDALYRLIGWDDLIDDLAYENTCATRVSLALIRSGIAIPDARMAIKAGPHKGKRIEPGQAKLSAILSRPTMFGKPEKFEQTNSESAIGSRSGIASFFRLIPGTYEGGHIDIISPMTAGALACGSDCYWTSKEVWFWPMK